MYDLTGLIRTVDGSEGWVCNHGCFKAVIYGEMSRVNKGIVSKLECDINCETEILEGMFYIQIKMLKNNCTLEERFRTTGAASLPFIFEYFRYICHLLDQEECVGINLLYCFRRKLLRLLSCSFRRFIPEYLLPWWLLTRTWFCLFDADSHLHLHMFEIQTPPHGSLFHLWWCFNEVI